MKIVYPYQDAFERDLAQRDIAQATRDEYTSTLKDFFHYLENFNPTYQREHRVNQLQTQDVEQYLAMLTDSRQILNATYNKVLSHLNVYFKFLFSHNWTPYLPTLDLKSKPKEETRPVNFHWVDDLADLLADSRLHVYTRAVLLLTAHGYPARVYLQPNFTATLKTSDWPADQQAFLQTWHRFVAPLQDRFQCADWLLKQRAAADPHLTLPGLHKYLRPDEAIVGFRLSPSTLYQGYLVNYLRRHPRLSDREATQQLHLEPDSIDYYRKLARQAL
ncbi:phage integrase N-terminal SAM-like domain-containing protein [Levilactobacillus namurensis]|uniref:Phage integrase N-terminal SAM-like domain-containing protein n=1 Tax=Levilactobacillus namurensis TaxID=380393 RepID=A0AAW8W100_9LACO|nr:site-specific integrase [Levilactobacillus namurensis]MDT7013112.1 phage integrase N-terminal SAM-like domain-containing protein [Levilactobacillus namurensis]